MMSQSNFDELLSAYLDGELSPSERARVEEQLQKDPKLQRLHQQLLYLRKKLLGLPRQAPRADFAAQVQLRLQQAHVQPAPKQAGSPRWIITSVATLAAALVVGWLLWTRPPAPTSLAPQQTEIVHAPTKNSTPPAPRESQQSLVESPQHELAPAPDTKKPMVDFALAALVECDITSDVLERRALEQTLAEHDIPLRGETGESSTPVVMLLVEAPLEAMHEVLAEINRDSSFLSLGVFPAPLQTAQRQFLRYRREPASAEALIAASHKPAENVAANENFTVTNPIEHAFGRVLSAPDEIEQGMQIVRTDADTGLSPAEIAGTLPHAKSNQPAPLPAPSSPTSVRKNLPLTDSSPMPLGFVRVLFRLHVIDAP